MAVIGQSHFLWRSRVPDHFSHSNMRLGLLKSTNSFFSLKYVNFFFFSFFSLIATPLLKIFIPIQIAFTFSIKNCANCSNYRF